MPNRCLKEVASVESPEILEPEREKPSYSACRTVHLRASRSPFRPKQLLQYGSSAWYKSGGVVLFGSLGLYSQGFLVCVK